MSEKQKKVQINIYELKSGMILGQEILSLSGKLMLNNGAKLNQKLIKKILSYGYPKIWIYDNAIDGDIEKSISKIRIEQKLIIEPPIEMTDIYLKSVETVKKMIKAVGKGENIPIEEVFVVSNQIVDKFDSNTHLLQIINKFRDIDGYTYTHCVNVALLCSMIGKWLYLSDNDIREVACAGLLHDIGKTKIPHEIIYKPSKLTNKEYNIIKKHPYLGYSMIKDMKEISKQVAMGVLMHHEREDGTGYTMKAKGNEINKFGKIIAIADIYDAMTSDRCYRKKQSPFQVLKLFEDQCFGVLDPEISLTFLNRIANYYIGDMITLNTGEEAEIIFIDPKQISRPLIRINNNYIDLRRKKELMIMN